MKLDTSKLLVISMVGAVLVVMVTLRLTYFAEEGDQKKLASVSCDSLLPTYLELQGVRIPIGADTICSLMREIATMTPTSDEYRNLDDDPWHYYGRLPIFPRNDVWFLVFIARRSSDFKPLFSLHHRKGGGWTVIGQFEAEPVLRRLGVWDRIDWEKLRSAASLKPTDENSDL